MIADCGLRIAAYLLLALCLSAFSGCGRPQTDVSSPVVQGAGPGPKDRCAAGGGPQKVVDDTASNPQSATGFAAAKISILPLTELSGASTGGQTATLNIYLVLLDAFGSQIKAPGVLRFELYSHVPRSARPKGPRIAIWPDVDLTRPVENNKYWQDFLRAYEFTLEARIGREKTYVLEATCLCPDGRRLGAEYTLNVVP